MSILVVPPETDFARHVADRLEQRGFKLGQVWEETEALVLCLSEATLPSLMYYRIWQARHIGVRIFPVIESDVSPDAVMYWVNHFRWFDLREHHQWDQFIAELKRADVPLPVKDLETEGRVTVVDENDVLVGGVRTARYHMRWVTCVGISADGQTALSASRDGLLIEWDMKTATPRRTLHGHTKIVRGVGISADGKIAISASEDKTLVVWDMATGAARHTLHGHTKIVRGVGISADGKIAISGGDDGKVILWDVAAGQMQQVLLSLPQAVNDVGLSADGNTAISVSEDFKLRVWDMQRGAVRRVLSEVGWASRGVLSGDGTIALTNTVALNSATVWDVETGLAHYTVKGDGSEMRGVAVNGQRVAAVTMGGSLLVWEGGQLVKWWRANLSLSCCAMSMDGRRMVVGDIRGNVHFVRVNE